jgi:RNA-directed DNA polymerase
MGIPDEGGDYRQPELFEGLTQKVSTECGSYAPEYSPRPRKPEDETDMTTLIGGRDTRDTLGHIVDFKNMEEAFRKVASNRGSGGIDGMEAKDLMSWFYRNYGDLREQLLGGTYKPLALRRVEIPKDNGKTRKLGIPTVIDRGVQMSVAQVLGRIWEPMFSDSSFGFRPKRSAHDAIDRSLQYGNEGYVWVVDMDLERFFDTVPQSRLLQLVGETVKDGRVVSLLYRFCKAGVMEDGVKVRTDEGVPQGGPLSPLLANILLNECDKELERRGLRFCRYADDMMIFCGSRRSAERVMGSVTEFVEKRLKLKVNREKTKVLYMGSHETKFLGYGFYRMDGQMRPTIHRKSIEKAKMRIREILDRNRSGSYHGIRDELKLFVMGWTRYYRKAMAKKRLSKLDEWVRHKIRALILTRCRRVRTRYRLFRQLGAEHSIALSVANARQKVWALAGFHWVSKWLNCDVLRRKGYTFFLDGFMHASGRI